MPANPRLMVEARPLVDSAFTANPGYAATIDTLFEVGGAPSARVREAERAADVARADRELERSNARVRVYSAYVAAQVAALRIGETRAAIEIAQRVLAAAQQRGLTFYTYADLARGIATAGAGVLISMDDAWVDDWVEGIPLYAQYGARLTFFVSYFPQSSDADRAGLHALAAAGHAIEAHSVKHLRAPLYVEQKGLDAYLTDEALPSIELLRAEGFDVTSYAYPYGARTGELDRALLRHVDLLRSVTFTWSGPADPCPE
jgi:hypothetical protein